MSASTNRTAIISKAKRLAKKKGDKKNYDRFNVKSTMVDCPLDLYLTMCNYIKE